MRENRDDNLTILLPVNGRTEYTLRWLSYAEQLQLPYQVFIADGEKEGSLAGILGKKDSFAHLEYEYFRFPGEHSCFDFYNKIFTALTQIKTEFSVLIDNDDLFFTAGLKRGVDFLLAHPEYSSCRGGISVFSLLSWDKKSSSAPLYGDAFWLGRPYRLKHNEEETASKRVQKTFLDYDITFYDVQRTGNLKEHFRMLKEIDLKDIFLAEIFLAGLNAASGKIRRQDSMYLLRQRNSSGSWAMSETEKGDAFSRMLEGSWPQDFDKFINTLAAYIAKIDRIPVNGLADELQRLYRAYISSALIDSLPAGKRNGKAGPLSWYGFLRRKTGSMLIKALRKRFWRQQVYFMEVPAGYSRQINFVRQFLAQPQMSEEKGRGL